MVGPIASCVGALGPIPSTKHKKHWVWSLQGCGSEPSVETDSSKPLRYPLVDELSRLGLRPVESSGSLSRCPCHSVPKFWWCLWYILPCRCIGESGA